MPIEKWRADEAFVATQEVLVQVAGVLLRRRHHVRLVAQRALTERDPHRRDVFLLAGHADVPPALVAVDAVHGTHDFRRRGERRQPLVDVRLEFGERRGVEEVAHRRRS